MYVNSRLKFALKQILAALKFRLIKQLLANGIETDIIYKLLEFVSIYLPFKKPEKEITFDREIESLIDKEKNMGTATIRELYDRKIREDERKMARKELLKTQRAAKCALFLIKMPCKLLFARHFIINNLFV
jgi:hypothetical protein